MIFSVKYEFFRKVRKFRTLLKYSYFMIFTLYQKIRTLPKNSYFTEIFVLDGKFRTPDVQVQHPALLNSELAQTQKEQEKSKLKGSKFFFL